MAERSDTRRMLAEEEARFIKANIPNLRFNCLPELNPEDVPAAKMPGNLFFAEEVVQAPAVTNTQVQVQVLVNSGRGKTKMKQEIRSDDRD